MAVSKKSSSIFPTIFLEGSRSFWLPIIFFLNAFFAPFLLPVEKLEAGYTMHHWDLVTATCGALLLLAFRFLNKNPGRTYLALMFFISGLAAAFVPYIWAEIALPHGIPVALENKWGYAFSGPVAQVVGFALIVGAVRYTRKISNSVAENRAALNILRRDIKEQIEQERNKIVELILTTVTPAFESVEKGIHSGADSGEISQSINAIIEEVVRPLSHDLDESASHVNYEINKRIIKREFRRKRIRTSSKNLIPMRLALSAPLSIFLYINFNLVTIAYLYGFGEALKVSVPFLLFSTVLFHIWSRVTQNRNSHLSRTLLTSITISLFQAISFATAIHLFGPEKLSSDAASFAFTTFLFSFLPALLGIGLLNLRANLEREAEITSEVAESLSVIKRELWSLRKKFAREIHGGLQSKLQILALKFEKDDVNRSEMADSLNSGLRALLPLEPEKPRIENFRKFVSELIEFWDGIATIKAEIGETEFRLISTDYLLAECLHEVIREAVNNAVKHSGATEISISLKSAKSSTFVLLVENNVSKEIKTSSEDNLGTSIYKELAHSWSLEIHPDSVKLNAIFASRS